MNNRDKIYFPFSSKNTTQSSLALFESRKFYEQETLKYIENNDFIDYEFAAEAVLKIPFGDLHKENYLYATIDEDGDIIAPIENENNFSKVGVNEVGNEIKIENFVLDAFFSMKSYLRNLEIKDKVSKDSFFFNLKIKKGFIGIDNFYYSTSQIISQKFRSLALSNKELDSKIKDEKSFILNYIPFLIKHMEISPVTKSSMTLFLNSKYFSNGITFAISSDKTGDDEKNFQKIFLDKSFMTFAEACRRFGFYIDKKNPQFLFMDIASPAVKPFLEKYNIKSVKDLFQKRYKKVHLEDIEALKEFFYISYITFLENNQFYQIYSHNECMSDLRKQEYKERYTSNYKVFLSKFREEFWYSLYIYLKNFETGYNLSQSDYDNFLKRCKHYIGMNRKDLLFKFLNNNFNSLLISKQLEALQKNNVAVQESQLFEPLTEQQQQQFSETINTSLIFRG